MEKVYFNKEGWVCNRHPYNFEIDDENSYIELDELESSKTYVSETGKAWKVINNELVLDVYDANIVDDNYRQYLRSHRDSLFAAFDIYKTNVFYGIENDSDRQLIIEWYQRVLDLDEDAINNPPQKIARYL